MSCYGNGCMGYALARTAGDGTLSRLQTPEAAPLTYVTGTSYQGLFSMPTVEQAYISQYQPRPEDSVGLQLLMVHNKQPDGYNIMQMVEAAQKYQKISSQHIPDQGDKEAKNSDFYDRLQNAKQALQESPNFEYSTFDYSARDETPSQGDFNEKRDDLADRIRLARVSLN